jgi:hypothetical protein
MTSPAPARLRWGRGVVLLVAALLPLGVMSAASAASPSASDTFSRTASGGWGQADVGGAWTVAPASSFAVSGGVGTVALTTDGRTQRAALPGSAITNDVAAELATTKLPSGTGLYVSVAGRQMPGVGQYQAKVRWLPSGAVSVVLTRIDARWAETALGGTVTVPGVNGSSSQPIGVRVQVSGAAPTTVRAKVWQASSAEPAAWTTTATDGTAGWQVAGGVGLDSYLSRNSVPLALRVDDVTVNRTAATGAAAAAQPPAPDATIDTATPAAGQGASTTGRATGSAGSVPVGTARYAVPPGAWFVSPSGGDGAAGTQSAPWRTLGKAVAGAPAGGTIVLRAGTYHESVTIPTGKKLTVQAYPGEAVWLDGSRDVTGWASDGSAWRADGWTAQFDHSPTYTKGAPDNTTANWSFVNASYPMAAYPDQVWIDGNAQRQVGSRNAVVPGTFFVDTANHRLYLGTNPSGHAVRASDLSAGLDIWGGGSVVRGIGVQRYATSVPEKGTVLVMAPDVTLENVVVRDNATQGMFVGGMNLGSRGALRHVTLERNGMLGVEASYSDGLVVDGIRVVGNNTEHFNLAPVSGGMKISRARGLTFTGSVFSDNLGTGLWFDESVYDATIVGSDLLRNAGHGLSYEISSKALIADDIVAGNGQLGMKINNASNVDIWNNTIVDNGDRPMWLVQDPRVAGNAGTPGHDPRQKQPDPTVTWLLGPLTVRNNVIGGKTGGNCLLCVQDSALHRTPSQIGLTVDGNAYERTGAGSPQWSATWPAGQGNPQVFSTLDAFRGATGQERNGVEFTGAPVVDPNYRLTPDVAARATAIAAPVPAALAARMGYATNEERLGARLG